MNTVLLNLVVEKNSVVYWNSVVDKVRIRQKFPCRQKFRCRPNFRCSRKYSCRQKFSANQKFCKNCRQKFCSSQFFSCRLLFMKPSIFQMFFETHMFFWYTLVPVVLILLSFFIVVGLKCYTPATNNKWTTLFEHH